MKRRAVLQAGGALALNGWAHDIVLGSEIVAVRVWPAADYTRITLESHTALAAQHFLAHQPARLVVDLAGLQLSPALREFASKVGPGDPFIAGMRVGQFMPHVVRLVVDLKQDVAPQIFSLDPVAAYRHRLIFDLHPLIKNDPLLALLRKKTQAELDFPDILGDFIARANPTEKAHQRHKSPTKPVQRLLVVALDPGHGGEDPGAVGPTGLQEKNVVLQIALQLRDQLNTIPGMRVFMTRDSDFYVPLQERVRKARQVQADLFVSIHADAFFKPHAKGASVFALSPGAASSSTASWMANKENGADRVGGVNVKAKDASVAHTLMDMSTAVQIKQSLRLGTEILGQMGKVGTLRKVQVEQAGFAVLKAPDIPSILVEAAFISNPQEEAKLANPLYQKQLAQALATGIQRYFAKNPPRPQRDGL